MGEMRNAFKILGGKLETMRPFGRRRCTLGLDEVGCGNVD
jgi:hypothetical protein